MNKTILVICITIILTIASGGLFYCCSYSPYWNEDLPALTNLYMNQAKLNKDNPDKTSLNKAYDNASNYYKIADCQSQVFGIDENGQPNPPDFNDSEKMNNFRQCLEIHK
jgi:type IV secretory pathway VirB6-like protein